MGKSKASGTTSLEEQVHRIQTSKRRREKPMKFPVLSQTAAKKQIELAKKNVSSGVLT